MRCLLFVFLFPVYQLMASACFPLLFLAANVCSGGSHFFSHCFDSAFAKRFFFPASHPCLAGGTLGRGLYILVRWQIAGLRGVLGHREQPHPSGQRVPPHLPGEQQRGHFLQTWGVSCATPGARGHRWVNDLGLQRYGAGGALALGGTRVFQCSL